MLLAIAARLMNLYLRVVWRTARPVFVNAELRQKAIGKELSFVYAMWHGRFVLATYDMRDGMTFTAIASRSGDGEAAYRIMAPFGIEAIRGSSASTRNPTKEKGGRAAFSAAVNFLRRSKDAIVGLTPDGPRGPRGVGKPGAAAMSASSGKPVIAVGYSASMAIELNSWDRFLIPLPFTRIACVWSDPLPAPDRSRPDALERHRIAIDDALNAATQEADRLCGRRPFAPEPDPARDG